MKLFGVIAGTAVTALVGAAAVVGVASVGQQQSSFRTPKATIMTWNMCGEPLPHCSQAKDPLQRIRYIEQQIARHQPAAVLLQEVCRKTLEQLNVGRDWTIRFAPILRERKAITCEGGRGQYGLAVIAPGQEIWTQLHPLPTPPRINPVRAPEDRVALCVRPAKVALQVCNAHFSTDLEDPAGSTRKAQVQVLTTLAEEARAAGYASVVGGDLNTPARSAGED